MRKIFVMVLVFATMLLMGCLGDNPKSTEKIVIGIDDEFPPLSFHDDNGKLVGFEIDLATEAIKQLGCEVEFKAIDWNDKRAELESGNINMIWNGLDVTEDRKEYILYSKPYMEDRQILLVRKGNTQDIWAEGDLEGKLVGTQVGSTSADYLSGKESLLNSFKGYKTYANFNETVDALKAGEIDVMICDELAARYEMKTHSEQLEIVDVKIGEIYDIAVGFRKDNTELRDRINKVLAKMVADGTATKISEQWFKADIIRYIK